MKHVVLGNGNLAQSLIQEIKAGGECEINHFHRGIGFDYPRCEFFDIHNFGMDDNPKDWIVWNTIGAGSIPEADKNFQPSMIAHLGLAAELDQTLPEGTTVINFSTDYASRPRLSRYAFSKSIMEEYVKDFARKEVYCVRVANLYGKHRPKSTLPYKLLANQEKITSLPDNIIHPTPTEWLAKKLLSIKWEEQSQIFNLAPRKGMSVQQFGEILFKKDIQSSGIDDKRPTDCIMDNSFLYTDSVYDCWHGSELKAELCKTGEFVAI